MMTGGWNVRAVAVLAFLAGILAPPTLAGKSLAQALEEGKIDVDLRYRYEHVEQEGFDEDADSAAEGASFALETEIVWFATQLRS